MDMKIVGITVAAFIVVVVIGSMLMPILDDADNGFNTVEQNTGGAYKVSMDNVPITFSYNESKYTLNGDDINADYTLTNQMVIISDKFIVATNSLNSGKTIYFATPGQTFKTISSITCSNGSVTYTAGGTDTTLDLSYTWIAYPANEGDYMFAGNLSSVNVDDGATIITGYMGPTVNGGTSLSTIVMAKGALDSITPEVYTGNTYTEATGAVSATYTEGTPNVLTPAYSIVVDSGGDTYTAATPNVIVPIQYHYVSSSDSNLINLIGVIPVLLIVAILTGIVALVIKRN